MKEEQMLIPAAETSGLIDGARPPKRAAVLEEDSMKIGSCDAISTGRMVNFITAKIGRTRRMTK